MGEQHERPDRAYPTRPHVAVGVVVIGAEGVLLIQRATPPRKGQWSIPGGGVELGEAMRECAVREVQEETGVKIECGPLIDVVDAVFKNEADGRTEYHYALIDFAAYAPVGDAPVAGEDIADARYVPLGRLDDFGLWDETKRIIFEGAQLLGVQVPKA